MHSLIRKSVTVSNFHTNAKNIGFIIIHPLRDIDLSFNVQDHVQ